MNGLANIHTILKLIPFHKRKNTVLKMHIFPPISTTDIFDKRTGKHSHDPYIDFFP